MTLSTSRQQFLAYESQGAEDIQYGRRGGIFVSTCVCVGLVILAVVLAALVGVIVHFITYFKLSQKPSDFWDETEPFAQVTAPSPDLRLPMDVLPSFYRLKINADLYNSTFSGDVYITIRASRRVKEIILHSKNLSINSNAKLTEQIYEKVETLHTKRKREAENGTVNTGKSEPVANTGATPNTVNESVVLTANVTQASSTVSTSVAPSILSVTTQNIPVDTHTQVTHSSVRNIKITSITESTGDRLILTLASALKPEVDYILELSFEGKISNSLAGFYKSTYTNNAQEVKQLGVTQFEPTSARAAFPCFDEPSFKAKFEISIAHHENISALSNMNVAAQEPIPDQPNWKWTHFERSVKMSTYLVAYLLSDFKSIETNYTSKLNFTKPIRIWTRPDLIHKAKYAAAITPKLLRYYEEVFGVPYALDKLDMVAIPDFSSGAMENWGLITFRETTLLVDEAESVPRDKQGVAIDIAHELAHQWFGNLVTMKWWTDLWLNEGFATYIEYVGVDHVEPEWKMLESFSRDKMDLLRTDALKNTSPVSREVVDASEISQKFDEISYTKGANLIRMLNHTLSGELFHKGLVTYLDLWKYQNAEENDLWQAMSTATVQEPVLKDRSLVAFMNSWTRQAGYPVVNVIRNYESGDVEFEQKLFTSSNQPYKKMLEQKWQIPISYTAMDAAASEWTTKPRVWLTDKSIIAHINVSGTQALYVNVDAIGYYRVNYDQKNWELLGEAIKSGKVQSPITKSQLIDDAFNLAKSSQLNYSHALNLTTYFQNGENSKTEWDTLLTNMAFLRHNLKATSGYVYFQDYIKLILKKDLERLNYGLNKPKDDNEAFVIETLLTWECNMDSERCINWAKSEFEKWTTQTDINNNPIPSYLRGLVYSMVLKHGGRREFDFLWNVFQNSTDPNVKTVIIFNLPSTREESLIAFLLEKSLTEIPKQYAVTAWNVDNPIGTRIAQEYLLNNFEKIYNKFTEIDTFMFPSILNTVFGYVATEEELIRLKSFAMKNKEKLVPMSLTLQKIVDSANLRIDWMKKHATTINQWFKNYLHGRSAATKPVLTTAAPSLNATTSPEVSANISTTAPANVPKENVTSPVPSTGLKR